MFLINYPEGWYLSNFEKTKTAKAPEKYYSYHILMSFLLIHIIDLHAPINNPNNNAAKKQGISGREPRESRAAEPTIPAVDIHINRQYLRCTWSTSADDISTSQSTNKTGSHTHSYTHDDGPPSRARWLGTGAGVWCGRGELGCLGYYILLLLHIELLRTTTNSSAAGYRCLSVAAVAPR